MLQASTPGDYAWSINSAARGIAEGSLDIAAIVTWTRSGFTARMVSKSRPKTPIIAATRTHHTARKMPLYWGMSPVVFEPASSLEDLLSSIDKVLLTEPFRLAGRDVLVLGFAAILMLQMRSHKKGRGCGISPRKGASWRD